MTRMRDGHLDWSALLELSCEERLPAAARSHIEGCAGCGAALAEVEQLVADMRSDETTEPPADLVRRVLAQFEARPSRLRRVVESVGRLVGGLPTPQWLPAGARGAAAAPARLLFECEGYEIEVELAAAHGGLRLMGQVAGPERSAPPLLVWAEAAGATLQEAPVSEHGAFLLDGLPDPPFDLVLETAERRLRVPLRSDR